MIENVYKIEYDKKAQSEIDDLRKSGQDSEIRKLEELIGELSAHPQTGTGKPEDLHHDMQGEMSRRIDKKDRIVYEVDRQNRIVRNCYIIP